MNPLPVSATTSDVTECTHCRRQYPGEVHFCPVDGFAAVPVGDPYLGRQLMGQFQLVAACGRGATGTVYRAMQSSMDRQVAVKVLSSELLTDPSIIKRFVREARAGARLSHPNIATVHLVGQTDEGVPYIVMEYIEGPPLSALLEADAPLPAERILHIGEQIASALCEAHDHGIIHRDLKPENILLTERRGEGDVVKVVDFGIAKIVADGMPADSQVSRLGTIFGTPHYIAPEQASGTEIDGRADLYSLGCILFQMATGRVPFEGTAGIQVLLRHLREAPPHPRALNPLLPEPLAVLILQLLAKERADRPPGADRVLREMQAISEQLRHLPQPASLTTTEALLALDGAVPAEIPAGRATVALSGDRDLDLAAVIPWWRRHVGALAGGVCAAVVAGLLVGTLSARGCDGSRATASTWRRALWGAGRAADPGNGHPGVHPPAPATAMPETAWVPGQATGPKSAGRHDPPHHQPQTVHAGRPRPVHHRHPDGESGDDLDDDLPETVFPLNGPPHSVEPLHRPAPEAETHAPASPPTRSTEGHPAAPVMVVPVAPPAPVQPAPVAPPSGDQVPPALAQPVQPPAAMPPVAEPPHPPVDREAPRSTDEDDRPTDPYERLK